MSILWMGAEDIDVANGIYFGINTNSTYYRANYARCCFDMTNYGYDRPVSIFKAFTGITDGWMSNYGYYANSYDSNNRRFFGLVNTASVGKGLFVGVAYPWNKFGLYKWDGSTLSLLATEAGSTLINGLIRLDMQITGFDDPSGTLNLYANGGASPILTYSGDLRISGVANLDAYAIVGVSNSQFRCSEFLVADEDTRPLLVVTHYPSGAGSANQWDGDGYGGIDEPAINDADLVYTNTAAEDCQTALSDCPTGTFDVKAIRVSARAVKSSDSSISTLKLGVLHNSTVDVDAGQTLGYGWADYDRISTTVNGNPITTTILNDMQLNLRSAA